MKRVRKILNIKCSTSIILKTVLSLMIVVVCVFSGYLDLTMNQITYNANAGEETKMAETFDNDGEATTNLEEANKELSWDDLGLNVSSIEGVTNILLCGEEAMEDTGRGRTDCIMLATINNEQNSLKITSLMRDTYVKIPGYSNNKLNAAYNIGGMPLLEQTIEVNFGIKIDGYILVDFEKFEKVIDVLGGVDIRLTKKEAKYLRNSNYISKKKNRDVKVGKNKLNGNQALGYCRIRYIETDTGLTDDYGRNYRQRTVLESIYSSYKSSTAPEMVALLPEIMSCITTDIKKDELLKYVYNVIMINASSIECYRVPMEGCYKNAKVGTMAVLYITDINGIRNSLSDYIYGTLDAGESLINSYEYYGDVTPTPKVDLPPVYYNFNVRTPTPKPVVVKTEKPEKTEKPKPTKVVKTSKPTSTPVHTDTPPNENEEEPIETMAPTNSTEGNVGDEGSNGENDQKEDIIG